jgi:hypothetical protein
MLVAEKIGRNLDMRSAVWQFGLAKGTSFARL